MKYMLLFALTIISFSDLLAQHDVAYFNHTQVSFFIGEESEDKTQKATIPSFQTINGIRYGENWAIGLGIGAEPFEYLVYPVFFSCHYFFNNLKYNPFFDFKVGHAFSRSHKKFNEYGYYGDFDHKGGLMFQPEVGVRFKMFDVEMTLSGGYRFQRLKSKAKQQNSYYTYEHQVEYNRVSFALGIMF